MQSQEEENDKHNYHIHAHKKRERKKKTSDTWDQLHRLSGTKLNTDNVIEFNFTEK